MNSNSPFYLRCLREAFEKKNSRNPAFSLRLFAKKMGLDSGSMSQILNGKRIPSTKIARRLCEKLELSDSSQKLFWLSLAQIHQSRSLRRLSPIFKEIAETQLDKKAKHRSVQAMDLDLFAHLFHWYHGALIEMLSIDGIQRDPVVLAEALGISEEDVKTSLALSQRLGLIQAGEDGGFSATHHRLMTAQRGSTSAAHRMRQRQILEKSIFSLETDPIEVRNHSAMTIAIDPSRIPGAKKMVDEFTQKLADYFDQGKKRQVYELSIGLFPLHKPLRQKVENHELV